MQSQMMPAIKVNQTLQPVKLTVPKPDVYVYDLGQICGGWTRLRMRGPAGTDVTIKYLTLDVTIPAASVPAATRSA